MIVAAVRTAGNAQDRYQKHLLAVLVAAAIALALLGALTATLAGAAASARAPTPELLAPFRWGPGHHNHPA